MRRKLSTCELSTRYVLVVVGALTRGQLAPSTSRPNPHVAQEPLHWPTRSIGAAARIPHPREATMSSGREEGALTGAQLVSAVRQGAAWLDAQLASSRQRCLVIGLSGGIDSAVTALWAASAVGQSRVVLVSLPYGLRAPSRFPASHKASVTDADAVAARVPDARLERFDIAPTVDAIAEGTGLAAALLAAPDDRDLHRDLGNVKARVRAVHLRYLANHHRGLVLGTENRTEHLLGYFTIGGDEESDLEILSPFLKRDVRALARELGVPQSVLDKAPSADLFAGQTDEGELGYSYADADAVLALTDGERSRRDTAIESGLSAEVVDQVLGRVEATDFKRRAKPEFMPMSADDA